MKCRPIRQETPWCPNAAALSFRDVTSPLAYQTLGSGPGLVLVHATSSTGHGTWAPVLDGLDAEHTVVLPDLPGSGSSPLPVGPLDADVIADQLAATATAAGLDTFAIAGASLGAPLAAKVAARHPERVTHVVSVVGFAKARLSLRLDLEIWASLLARKDDSIGKFLLSLTFSDAFLAGLSDAQVQQFSTMLAARPAVGTPAQIDLALRLDARPDLARITAPTLVVLATEDRHVRPAHSRELAAGIKNARVVETPGGHGAMFEDPKTTLTALLDFL